MSFKVQNLKTRIAFDQYSTGNKCTYWMDYYPAFRRWSLCSGNESLRYAAPSWWQPVW